MDGSPFQERTVNSVSLPPFLIDRTEAELMVNARRTAMGTTESHASAQADVESMEAARGHARLGDGFHEDSELI
jgi:hypothetical protein